MENSEIQTRQELTRSVEDAEKYKAIQTLTQLGLLTPLSKIETFHGRVGKKNGENSWVVDPTFENYGNASGNFNVNARSTLYTTEAETAENFAQARKKELSWRSDTDDLQAEVHRIISTDPDATVINLKFDPSKLSNEDNQRYMNALNSLVIPVTEGSPVDFYERNAIVLFRNAMNHLRKNFVMSEDISEISQLTGISESVALQLASGYNARQILRLVPTGSARLVNSLLIQQKDIYTDKILIDGEERDIPINLEYVQRYLHAAHIVGAEQSIDSVTVNRRIKTLSFFDLSNIGTSEQIEIKQEATRQLLGPFIDELPKIPQERNEQGQALFKVLEDFHTKPEKIIEATKKVPGYEAIFNMDAGNWEGFTLAEHTETVLRIFDDNYADIVPAEYLYPIRLAIVIHDIGKPIATAKGEKYKQKEYNAEQAEHFLTQIGIEAKTKKLLIAIIGEGSDLAFRIHSNQNDTNSKAEMRSFATKTLKEYLASDDITDAQINAFIVICSMLQTCDGGAYTSMAITRREEGGHFRNAPSFNESFAPPINPGKRDIQYRRSNQPPAPKKLTPAV